MLHRVAEPPCLLQRRGTSSGAKIPQHRHPSDTYKTSSFFFFEESIRQLSHGGPTKPAVRSATCISCYRLTQHSQTGGVRSGDGRTSSHRSHTDTDTFLFCFLDPRPVRRHAPHPCFKVPSVATSPCCDFIYHPILNFTSLFRAVRAVSEIETRDSERVDARMVRERSTVSESG
jgi:hypothetical protein